MEFGSYKYVLYILSAASVTLCSYLFYMFWRKKSSPPGIRILGSRKIMRAKNVIIIVSILLAAFTLLEPRWGERTRNVENEGSDVVIAVDVSLSMLAEDVKPSRLERAKSAVKRVAESLPGGRVALILFAGDSFLSCPLTSDIGAFLMFTDSASPDSVRLMGTDIGKALTAGQKIFEKKRISSKIFVLITDGEDNEGKALSAVEPLKELGVSIYTVGVGRTEGGFIPYAVSEQGESKKFYDDGNGKPVRTRKNVDLLQKLADETNGKYIDITEDISGMRRILEAVSEQTKEKYAAKIIKEKEEKFMFFAFLLLILLSVELMMPEKKYIGLSGRKRPLKNSSLLLKLFIIAAAFLTCAWLDPYKDEVAQGNKQLKDKNVTEAKKHYKNAERYAPSRDDLKNLEFNKAVADFVSGDTDSAMDGYRNALRSENKNVQKKAFYSLGNVYYKAGKKREAAQAYMNALKLDPNYESAKKNLEYIFLYNEKEDQNRSRNDDGENNKDDDNKDKNRRNKKNQNKFGDDDSGRKLDMQQARNILESMKNSKVRQEKGKRHASRSLEKYW